MTRYRIVAERKNQYKAANSNTVLTHATASDQMGAKGIRFDLLLETHLKLDKTYEKRCFLRYWRSRNEGQWSLRVKNKNQRSSMDAYLIALRENSACSTEKEARESLQFAKTGLTVWKARRFKFPGQSTKKELHTENHKELPGYLHTHSATKNPKCLGKSNLNGLKRV